MQLTNSWWVFDHSNKIDVLREPNHTHLIHAALGDIETNIESHHDGTYSLYGKQEALLVIPSLLSTKLLLSLFQVVKMSSVVMV